MHGQLQYVCVPGAPVAEIAQEDDLPAFRMRVAVLTVNISELTEQFFQFVTAAVNVPDNIERTVFVLFVVPHFCPDDFDVVQLILRVDDVNEPETFPLQVFD